MGIQYLHQNIKSIQTVKDYKSYNGQRIGIDAYAWIHKALFSCAETLAKKIQTTKHIDQVMKRIKELQDNNITPIMVMDGQPLPSKKETEIERKQNRKDYLEKANEYKRLSEEYKAKEESYKNNQEKQNELKEAEKLRKQFSEKSYTYYGLSVDVNAEMAQLFLNTFQQNGIETIIAPYEADSQLAFLNQIGYIDFIISEDSDLICFGAKKILFKYNLDKITKKSFGYEFDRLFNYLAKILKRLKN